MAEERVTLSEIQTTSANGYSGRFYIETRLKNEGKEGFFLTVLNGENVWEGIISEDDLDHQCTNLKMDFETYVKETKAAFTQENTAEQNFECHLKLTGNSAQLSWKKAPTLDIKYNLGSVNLRKCSNPATTSCDVFSHCIAHVRTLQAQVKHLDTDNERLTKDRQNALKRLDKCVTAKEELEKDLYSKFVLVLNSKKERIRLLEEEIQSLNVSDTAGKGGSSTPATRTTTASKNGAAVKKKVESSSEDYDVNTDDDQGPPPNKQQRASSSKIEENEETFLKLSEDEEEKDSKLAPAARRPQRQRGTKKQTSAKPTLPRVSSGNSGERPGIAARKSTLRKSGSGTSNKSSDNLDPDDLIDNF